MKGVMPVPMMGGQSGLDGAGVFIEFLDPG
jgi:hypothetical protein